MTAEARSQSIVQQRLWEAACNAGGVDEEGREVSSRGKEISLVERESKM